MDCPFCDIDKERNTVIKYYKDVFVMFSNPRLMEGHLLVVPKRHVEKISELNEEEKKELFDTVIKYQEKILKNIAPGCDIRQHYRPFLKQSELKINHLHIHLQPRDFDDELYKKCQIYYKDVFKELTEQEINKISKLL